MIYLRNLGSTYFKKLYNKILGAVKPSFNELGYKGYSVLRNKILLQKLTGR